MRHNFEITFTRKYSSPTASPKKGEVVALNPMWFVWALLFAGFLGLIPHSFGENATSFKNRIKIKKRSYMRQSNVNESEELSLEKLELKEKKRKQLILEMRRFIREARPGAQKAELNSRLAALYMEDYYQSLEKAQRIYEKRLDAYEKLSKKKEETHS